MSEDGTSRIIQIAPARGGWVARFSTPKDSEGDSQAPIACWALRDDGSVVGLVSLNDSSELALPDDTLDDGEIFDGIVDESDED